MPKEWEQAKYKESETERRKLHTGIEWKVWKLDTKLDKYWSIWNRQKMDKTSTTLEIQVWKALVFKKWQFITQLNEANKKER